MLSKEFILVLLLICSPLALVFGGGVDLYEEPSIISISSVLSISAVALALALSLKSGALRGGQNRLLINLIALLLAIYGLNYAVTSYASGKWLVNTAGFIFIFYSVVVVVVNGKDELLLRASPLIKQAINIIMILFIFMAGATLLSDSAGVYEALWLGQNDQNIYLLTKSFNVEKQALGMLFSLVVIWNIVFWPSLTRKQRFVFLVFLLILFPFWIGIQTSILALTLLLVYWLIAKRVWARMVLVLIFPLVILIFVAEWGFVMEVVSEYYDRLPSLLFALDTLMNTPFGIGNGGYHIVVEAFNTDILAQFGSEKMESFSFWTAPESDLVYFIASFGVLSLVFFGFHAFLLIKGVDVLRSAKTLPVERFLFLACVAFIFSGISQDNAGGLIWWVYMAAGFAVVLRRIQAVRRATYKVSAFEGRSA